MFVIEFLDDDIPSSFDKVMICGLDNIKELKDLIQYKYIINNNLNEKEAEKVSFLIYDVLDIKGEQNAQFSTGFLTYRVKITWASPL